MIALGAAAAADARSPSEAPPLPPPDPGVFTIINVDTAQELADACWNLDAAYIVDVPIYTTSPGSVILQNSVLTHGLYGAAVEVRFTGATGVEVRGNLMDAIVRPRDGAAPLVADNITDADPAWFVDETTGNLHLQPDAAPAIDQLDPLPGCSDDFDGAQRPAASGAVDVGADELEGPLLEDGFESGDTSAWTATVPG